MRQYKCIKFQFSHLSLPYFPYVFARNFTLTLSKWENRGLTVKRSHRHSSKKGRKIPWVQSERSRGKLWDFCYFETLASPPSFLFMRSLKKHLILFSHKHFYQRLMVRKIYTFHTSTSHKSSHFFPSFFLCQHCKKLILWKWFFYRLILIVVPHLAAKLGKSIFIILWT